MKVRAFLFVVREKMKGIWDKESGNGGLFSVLHYVGYSTIAFY